MFEQRIYRSVSGSAAGTLGLIFHATVRNIRKGHSAGGIGLVKNILQSILLIGFFYAFFTILGLRGAAIRGDFMLYLMSGVFLFMTHIMTVKSVAGAEGPTSAMMLHAPMNTIIAIASTALTSLYLQILSVSVILFVYHAAFTPITIHDPIGAIWCLILSWFSGVAVGMVFLAMKPWFPDVASMINMMYRRLSMIASGKMFVANTLPGFMLPLFNWHPLFHTIDQARGDVFVNYNPHYTTLTYPILLSLALVMIGLMGEFYARKHASLSWSAR